MILREDYGPPSFSSMRKLTLLTATGARPKVWEICKYLMQRQTFQGPVRWIIVDDGPVQQPLNFKKKGWDVEVIRPIPYWINGQNTQSRNLAVGLKLISQNEWVVIIEDDDYYDQKYLEDVHSWLHVNELVGEGYARYFNIATMRGQFMDNGHHASLCSTAVRGAALAKLKKIVDTNTKFIDLELWKTFQGQIFTTKHVVGIKGLPGRAGIGVGHRLTFGNKMDLSSIIGEDSKIYETRFPEAFGTCSQG